MSYRAFESYRHAATSKLGRAGHASLIGDALSYSWIFRMCQGTPGARTKIHFRPCVGSGCLYNAYIHLVTPAETFGFMRSASLHHTTFYLLQMSGATKSLVPRPSSRQGKKPAKASAAKAKAACDMLQHISFPPFYGVPALPQHAQTFNGTCREPSLAVSTCMFQ